MLKCERASCGGKDCGAAVHGRETVGKMEKFSVKKPFTVLVAVVMVLILGFVAITKMQTNLLPDVSTPYLMVVTVYPGASPERVESEVSDVLQNALTVPGVENITATSAENYSLLLMHFTDDTDMNSALVKVSNKLDQAKSDLPSSCLTPSIIEYSLNMNAFMTVAVSREGSDIYQMSELVKDTLVPYVQRKGGVSNVSSSGLVEKLVQVQLNQDKIDEINAQLLDLIDTKLADARAQLDSAESQIAAGRAEYDRQMKNFGNTVSNTVLASMSTEVGNAVDVVRKQAQALMESVNQLIAVVKEPEIQQALIEVQQGLQKVLDKFDNTGMRDIDSLIEVVSELRDVTDKLTDALQKLQERVNAETGTEGSSAADLADELQLQQSLQVIYSTLEDTIKAMDNVPQLMSTFSGALGSFTQQQLNAYMQFTEAREQLNEYEKQLETAKQEYETARTQALAQADVQKQLDINTLSTLIYAQNFSMPAGYVQDASGESWLLKVGEEYNSVNDIAGALLLHVDGYGDVRLSDVADVEVIDNAADSFTRLNGEQAAVLKIYKNATSSASDVSDNCLSAFQELEAQYDGLHIVVLSNQGNYITIIIRSILTSMAVGAALAIIVLAIFLKDVKPTLVVGISIPLSVLFAVVLMYFTGLDMNIMTLAGLSLGIGMLVDNSIVVIENIYRLRSRGVPAARAAVQGTKQVGMAIMASTLTSVCVFLPVIFTSGVIKSLLQPMSMCIGYCLAASLIVALTVAPAASSTLLKNSKPKELKWFDKVQEKYVKSLEWCFQHRWAPLGAAVVLLVFCGWRVMSMGVEMLPTITSNEAIVTLSTEKDLTKEESYSVAENVIDALLAVDNVEEVGVTTDSRVAGMDVGQLGLPQTITDLLKGNGYLAVYIAGMMVGNNKIMHRKEIYTFMDGLTWLFQIIMFLCLGLLVNPHEMLEVAVVALLIGVFMIVVGRPLSVFLCLLPFGKRITLKSRLFVSWVGLRGAVPIIFATYPVVANVPGAHVIFNIVFFITIVSLVIQGTTVSWVARLLGLSTPLEKTGNDFGVELPEEIDSNLHDMTITQEMLEQADTLKDMNLPKGTLVMIVKRGDEYLIPNGTLKLHAGDKLLLISENSKE